jgi:hypothetical protein
MISVLLAVSGLPMVLANVPRERITNDTSIYQNLHEIKISKTEHVNFDSDIEKLSGQEKKYREGLPLRISAPMERVRATPYRAGKKANTHKRFQNKNNH